MGPGEPGPRSHIPTATVSQTFSQNCHLIATRVWPSEKEDDFSSALIGGKTNFLAEPWQQSPARQSKVNRLIIPAF
jgi:hypothetical protein